MISSMTMTAMLNNVTMMTDSQSVIAASLAVRRGLRLVHRAPSRLPPLAQDEAGAEVRERHRQQRLGADEADPHPHRQQPAHDGVEADVREGPQRSAADHAHRRKADRLARGHEGLADGEVEVVVDPDLLDDAGKD